MGLDISYYKLVKEIPRKEDDDLHYENDEIIIEKQPFKLQLGTLKEESVYEMDYIDSFASGSYGGYNGWRNRLYSLVYSGNIDDYWEKTSNIIDEKYTKKLETNIETMPFLELINFSDCEGIIGPEICEKLSKDFQEYDELMKDGMDSYDYELYCDFKNAFNEEKCVMLFH